MPEPLQISPLFRKLNLKSGREIVVLDAPSSFEAELALLSGVSVRRFLDGDSPISFALAFVCTQTDLDAVSAALTSRASADATLWFAYPKQASRRYRCDFNRDTGWHVLGAAGWEGVRQVAIDADWSALRFRRVEHIPILTRDEARAISAVGKTRAAKT